MGLLYLKAVDDDVVDADVVKVCALDVPGLELPPDGELGVGVGALDGAAEDGAVAQADGLAAAAPRRQGICNVAVV